MRTLSTLTMTLTMVATLTLFASLALAAGHPVATTVESAKVSGVDTDVRLDGHVVKQISDGKYLFADGTGELLVDILDPAQRNLAVEGAEIELTGNVVDNFMYTEVKADTVVARK
ncbi:MAG: NirD/YgiW/YdeI family stress tolerance protein [Pseudodesulfovibrio sp.]